MDFFRENLKIFLKFYLYAHVCMYIEYKQTMCNVEIEFKLFYVLNLAVKLLLLCLATRIYLYLFVINSFRIHTIVFFITRFPRFTQCNFTRFIGIFVYPFKTHDRSIDRSYNHRELRSLISIASILSNNIVISCQTFTTIVV